MLKKNVKIELTRGTGDCDDCGWYGWGSGLIEVEGQEPLYLEHDGHLGGSNWEGTDFEAFNWALLCLNIKVVFSDDPDLGSDIYYVNDRSAGFRQMIERKLHGDNPVLINVIVETDEVFSGAISAKVEKCDLLSQPIALQTSYDEDGRALPGPWDGDLSKVLFLILQQVSNLEFKADGSSGDDWD